MSWQLVPRPPLIESWKVARFIATLTFNTLLISCLNWLQVAAGKGWYLGEEVCATLAPVAADSARAGETIPALLLNIKEAGKAIK